MGNYISHHYHFVFTIKDREPLIEPAIERNVWNYLGGVARKANVWSRAIGGMEDHVHILCDVPASLAVSDVIGLIKGGSSFGIKDQFPQLRQFKWQEGYGSFTVSPSAIDKVASYIRNQRRHHINKSLLQEMDMLEKACPSQIIL